MSLFFLICIFFIFSAFFSLLQYTLLLLLLTLTFIEFPLLCSTKLSSSFLPFSVHSYSFSLLAVTLATLHSIFILTFS